tara:strand:- start:771 stop:983 length:213 start_codon:yes stop_codon:yes gene_type:complete
MIKKDDMIYDHYIIATRGGGYINEIAREQSKLIKTPLQYNIAWNEKVNQAKTMEDINKLKIDKDEKDNKR